MKHSIPMNLQNMVSLGEPAILPAMINHDGLFQFFTAIPEVSNSFREKAIDILDESRDVHQPFWFRHLRSCLVKKRRLSSS